MPKTYYIFDEDGDVFKTQSREEAKLCARESASTVISPDDGVFWYDDAEHPILEWEAPERDDDDEDDDEGDSE